MQASDFFSIIPRDGAPQAERRPLNYEDDQESVIESARQVLLGQGAALLAFSERVDHSFADAVQLILGRSGRVIVCGIGKSGLVGRKIAATLASTGTPAFFLHASEALHGDLGMVTPEDTVLLISNSGNTKEVLSIVPALHEMDVPVIAMCSGGALSRNATVHLSVAVDREACPLNLAPTTSTLVTLALGDALALALSQARGFEEQDFARRHPGGELGRRLYNRVRDVMHKDALPLVLPTDLMSDVLLSITAGRCGLAIVQDAQNNLLGVITDGDLRRALQREPDLLRMSAQDIMTTTPVVISERSLASVAEKLMEQRKIKALIALDDFGHVSGVVEFFST